ncbi:MAG: nucleotide sugar dehydrogenase [Bdellovibrionales bacterium]|nr:nucleotide sugar dehydrogenase [Bdellovibrionales bacterium]
MNISIIGAGRIGLILGACLAERGHSVLFTDRDFKKLKDISLGRVPFYEPGLKALFRKNKSRLKWVEEPQDIIASEIIFLTLSLPVKINGDFDMSGVKSWIRQIIRYTEKEKLLILKSTFPLGTNRVLQSLADKAKAPLHIVTCPEFLRQGQALSDIQNPDRIVIAGPSQKVNKKVERLYKSFSSGPVIFTSPETAEISKLAANSFLALKISFINLIANVSEGFSVDMNDLKNILGSDPRIGKPFLQPGLGFGGSCLPKDLKHLIFQGQRQKNLIGLLKEVEALNRNRVPHFFQQIKKQSQTLTHKTYAFWGLSFKANTDDIRTSPAVLLALQLLKTGAKIQIFDPLFKEEWKSLFHFSQSKKSVKVTFHNTPLSALKSAHGLIIGTDWKGFQKIPLDDIKSQLKTPFIVDGRGIFNVKELMRKGFKVYQAGGIFHEDSIYTPPV